MLMSNRITADNVKLKRAYERSEAGDGTRILIDRLWPRGVRKVDAAIDQWAKDMAPSTALRKWFGHDPAKWNEFRVRYFSELKANPDAWRPILDAGRQGPVTLLYGAKDQTHNNAVALCEFLKAQVSR